VLEKVVTGLRQSAPDPIVVPAHRMSRLDCLRNLHSFSAEGRHARHFDALPDDEKVAVLDSSTRIRQCYGWVRVRGRDFRYMNRKIVIDRRAERKGEGAASYLSDDQEYFAIVYEYLPKTDLERDAVQRQLDFFHHIGFQPCQTPRPDNWQGPGILLDFGDYNSPVDSWFRGQICEWYRKPGDAKYVVDYEAVWKRAGEEARRKYDNPNEGKESGNENEQEGKEKSDKQREEEKEEKARKARSDTAKSVERGYLKSRWYLGYFERKWAACHPSKQRQPEAQCSDHGTVTPEERQKAGLLEDPLAHIDIPEILPKTVRRAWRRYGKLKAEYCRLESLGTWKTATLTPRRRSQRGDFGRRRGLTLCHISRKMDDRKPPDWLHSAS
jgi:hypothetical protein